MWRDFSRYVFGCRGLRINWLIVASSFPSLRANGEFLFKPPAPF